MPGFVAKHPVSEVREDALELIREEVEETWSG